MNRLVRQLCFYALILFIGGCSGGGCGSCAGGAIHPIHGEYPITPETRIPRSMQIRLSDQGLRTVQAIAPDLFAGFVGSGINVPPTSGSMSGFYYDVCPSPPCTLHVSLPATPPPLELNFAAPNQIAARIRVIVQGDIPVRGCPTLGCSSSCGGTFCVAVSPTINIDTTRGSYPYIGLSTNIAIARDTHAQRQDFHRADLVSPTGSGSVIQETPGETVETADINCTGSILCPIVNLLRSTLISQFQSQIANALGPIQNALATNSMPDPPGCPTGTTATSGGKCNYPDMTLVPTLFGTEGTGNFGALVASITPGLRANDSYVIAAGDHAHDAQVVSAGMTIDAFGAVVSGGHSSCVPRMTAPAIPTIPEWTNLRQNDIPGTSTVSDLAVGVSEDFMNSTMWNLWDSGLFCLGVNTRMSQFLSAGTFSALPQLNSLRNVIFPSTSAPAALVLRPQLAPTVHVGMGTATDPLLTIAFHNLAMDFYAWSEERYVRFMTVNTDLSIPVQLMTDMGGIRPSLGMAQTANTTVTNSQLLTNQPAQIAGVLGTLLGTAIGMFAGALPAVNLPSIPVPGAGGMPVGTIGIQIPAMGIRGEAEGMSRYLALYANLQYHRAGMMDTIQMDTNAQLERMPFDAHVYDLGPTFSEDQLPHFRVRANVLNDFGHDVEYSWRVDDLTWQGWTTSDTFEISSPSFLAQGAHWVDVRARVVDEPNTVDPEPVRLDFTIDTIAPTAQLAQEDGTLVISAEDNVTSNDHLQYAVTFDNGAMPDFDGNSRVRIPAGVRSYEVHVRDESGNLATLSGNVDTLLIRGGPSTDAASGCGCSTPGARTQQTQGLLAVIVAGLFALSLLRRRREEKPANAVARRNARTDFGTRLLLWSMIPLFFVALGCDCSGGHNTGDAGPDSGACPTGQRLCHGMNRCVSANNTCSASNACPPGQAPNGTPQFNDTTCGWNCNCMPLPPLNEGMAGSHLDMAVASDNTIWFSAYSAGDARAQMPYGDLVVGTYDRTMNAVSWNIVDGVPSNGTVGGDVNGWRHGITDPGDDVGRWNSIQLDSNNHARVAYWDTTHDALKYASYDGETWTIMTVDNGGHNGRYASMVLLPGGIPAIAYRATIADTMHPGHVLAVVRYAKANNAAPHAASDWVISTVTQAATSCRAADCTGGTVCVQSTGVCTMPGGTCMACSATQACVAGACANIYTPNWVEDLPPGIGLFNSLRLDAMNHPQLVYYDRDRGNLVGVASNAMGMWGTPFIIDGEDAMGHDLGDRGMWSSLAIASDGSWHVAYVDAYAENVRYVHVTGMTPGTAEVVDDGSGVGMTPFPDGQHVIGDSVMIDIDTMGAIRVVYQDSTAGNLRIAQRGTMGWTVSTEDMMNHTGYWARIRHGNVATFWRDMTMNRFGVRVLAVH